MNDIICTIHVHVKGLCFLSWDCSAPPEWKLYLVIDFSTPAVYGAHVYSNFVLCMFLWLIASVVHVATTLLDQRCLQSFLCAIIFLIQRR